MSIRASIARTMACAVALTLWTGCGDPASVPVVPPHPNLSETCVLDCDETDGATGELSDADYASLMPAMILNPSTFTRLSAAGSAGASGYQQFTGSKGTLDTEMNIYFQGGFVASKDDDAEYTETVFDWLSSALGFCSSVAQLIDGEDAFCPHTLEADVSDVSLSSDCGHSVRSISDHHAEMIVKGTRWSEANTKTDDVKSQMSCTEDVGGGGGDPNSGEDEAVLECPSYDCTVWYWTGTGEIIAVSCTCNII